MEVRHEPPDPIRPAPESRNRRRLPGVVRRARRQLYAAIKVGSGQIVDGSVRSRDIRDNDVRGRDIRTGEVRSSDVRNGTLLARDFKTGEIPAGPAGPTGPRGATGATGPRGPQGLTGAIGPTFGATVRGDEPPESGGFNILASADVTVPQAGTLLVIAGITGNEISCPSGCDIVYGTYLDGQPVAGSAIATTLGAGGSVADDRTLVGTREVGAGTHTVSVRSVVTGSYGSAGGKVSITTVLLGA